MPVSHPYGPKLLEFTVPGQPAGSGSKTAGVKGKRGHELRDREGRLIIFQRPASELTAPWMQKVEDQAREEWGGRDALDGALWLSLSFYELRPDGHYLADGRLNPSAPAYPHQTATHDRDKMVRAICDSLKRGGVIADDKRVVAGPAWKFYADYPPRLACAVIQVGRMAYQTVEEAEIPSPPPPDQETLV